MYLLIDLSIIKQIIRIIILCFCITLLNRYTAKSQNRDLYFNSFKVKDGLPNNSVLSIIQDTTGYIWFSTKYGLCRYDSRNFKIFKHEPHNNKSLSSSDLLHKLILDNKRRLWIASSGLDSYNSTSESFNYIPIQNNGISTIFSDSRGRIWVGSNTSLKYFYPDKPKHLTTVDLKTDTDYLIYTIYEDHEKHIWIGSNKGLFVLSFNNNNKINIKRFRAKYEKHSLGSNDISSITEDAEGNIWIGTRTEGISLFDKKTNTFYNIRKVKNNKNSLIGNNVRKILLSKDGNLWIGTQDGLSILNPKNMTFSNHQHDPSNPHSLSQNSIYDIYQDKNGSIWLGTYFGGLNVVYSVNTPFKIFQSNNYDKSISSNIISAITEDPKNNLWIGTEAAGLNYFDRTTKQITSYKNEIYNKESLSSNLVKAIAIDKNGYVFIGTATGGLNVYDPKTNKFKSYRFSEKKMNYGISTDDITCMLVTHNNDVLIGTNGGLKHFVRDKENLKSIPGNNPRQNAITSLFEDANNNIWVGTRAGIALMTTELTLKQVDFLHETNNIKFNFSVNCFQEDDANRIWVGTYHQGLVLLDIKNLKYKVFTTKAGLPSNNILGILNDGNQLWISTDNGLSKFDMKDTRFQNLTIEDGLPDNQFNKGSYYKHSNGEFYFGTYNGLISFNPKEIAQNANPPRIVFSDLKLFNIPVRINDKSNLLKKDLNHTKDITFTHDQSVFTIEFVALNFIKSTKNKYAFKLEGFDEHWNYVDNPSATYTNLPSGSYQFLVKGANNDGIWSNSPSVITITILPPPWKTWWALILYFLAIFIISRYIIKFLQGRAKLKQELYVQRIDADHQKTHYQMKLDFFTNISHEIRTPLTLILGPIEKLADLKIDNDHARQYIGNIKDNANRLYRLVTELLDFRKADSENLKLHFCEEDIVEFLKAIYSSFKATAEIKDINFELKSEIASILVYFDKNQLEKVFSNLLINAIKFTHPGGMVKILIKENKEKKQVEIEINDNGKGIAINELDNIFENFYQTNQSIGTGIGLALTKSLIELHKGTIAVTSNIANEKQEGFTSFFVTFRLGKAHLAETDIISPNDCSISELSILNTNSNSQFTHNTTTVKYQKKSSILLVEDNDEVREFLKQSLEYQYHVIESINGHDGWKNAIEKIPDLIISDVMMPVMDGLAFCSKIKSDLRTCHIPVILLTAKSAPLHQIQGLQNGADAYITKPFSNHILQLNIHNMLTLKASLQKKYSEQLQLKPLINPKSSNDDEKFIQKLQDIIDKNIHNSNLDVTTLTGEIGMSKSVLYKKFSALTNQSLNNFIKIQRLKKAVELFQEGDTSVISVAVKVGFNDQKYFSKEFKKLYNVTPKEYLNNNTN